MSSQSKSQSKSLEVSLFLRNFSAVVTKSSITPWAWCLPPCHVSHGSSQAAASGGRPPRLGWRCTAAPLCTWALPVARAELLKAEPNVTRTVYRLSWILWVLSVLNQKPWCRKCHFAIILCHLCMYACVYVDAIKRIYHSDQILDSPTSKVGILSAPGEPLRWMPNAFTNHGTKLRPN